MMMAVGTSRLRNALSSDEALMADALLGGGLPVEAESEIKQAGLAYHDDLVAEGHLRRAAELAPGHPAVLISFYRYYFYKNRLREALAVAKDCLAIATAQNNLPANWRDVRPGSAVFDRYEEVLPRFFLFTLKGYAYLNMRLGQTEEGVAAARKLLDLDPSDKIGARVLLDVAARAEQDDDDD